jgi:membrane-bound lytic murein transglycosylase B
MDRTVPPNDPADGLRGRSARRPSRKAGLASGPLSVVIVALVLTVGAGTVISAGVGRSRANLSIWLPPVPPATADAHDPAAGAGAKPAVSSDAALPLNPASSSGPDSAGPGRHAAPGWVAAVAQSTRIPPIALRAYANATLSMESEQPSCHVGWTTLAAIGAVESGHGSHGGASLLNDGTTSIRILGPALDGRPGFAAIRATPQSTSWHGDPTWDHAVGPLQFLPSTWIRWAADGDGDGTADPNNINDAAVTAARYLCASGADLTGAAGWSAAVSSYNHSDQYVTDVLVAANGYAATSRSTTATTHPGAANG